MITLKCLRCGMSFEVLPYRTNAKYCSYECYWSKSSNRESKECSKCHKVLAISQFQKINRGWQSACRFCRKKEWRNWARRNDTKHRYNFYARNAQRNNRKFEISFESFKTLVETKPCYYCGSTGIRLGLDRIDNTKSYSFDNVVSCCRLCNRAKSDLSKWEFINLCCAVAKKHGAS